VLVAAQAWCSTHSPIATIAPLLSARGMNPRRDRPKIGMAPAQQGFVSLHGVTGRIDDRLEIQVKLATHQRVAEIGL
jgi:hypothetical protein